MAMTAKGMAGSTASRAADRQPSASAVSCPAATVTASSSSSSPSTSRAATRSSSRWRKRWSPRWRSSTRLRQDRAAWAPAANAGPDLVASPSGSPRATSSSGLCSKPSAKRRLVPRSTHSRRAASGDSRNVVTSSVTRCSPEDSRRSPRRPRSGSGDSDSQLRTRGSICCMSRDERVSPPASSRSACRVRSASANPKAASLVSAASVDSTPGPAAGASEKASSRGRKKRRS